MIREKYVSSIKELSVNVSRSRIDSIKRKAIEKTGLRIYDGGCIGYAGAIGRYDAAELEKSAINTLKNGISYPWEPAGSLELEEDLSPGAPNEDVLLGEFEKLLDTLRETQPDFIFSDKLKLIEQDIRLTNDNGLRLHFKDRYIDMELSFKEKTSINIIDGAIAFSGRTYGHEALLKDFNEVCNAYKNIVELPEGERLPVVFTTQDKLPMLQLLQDLNGSNFGSSSSLMSGKTGQKLFNGCFTLYQTNDPAELPTAFFDAEGTVNRDYSYSLIESGVLVSPYTDKRTAARYGLPLTGSAWAEYDSVPTLGHPNLKIKESGKTAKELLGGEPAILVMIASGGDFTPAGDFATPVQLAFLFDGEKLIGRLPELNISSNVFDMFGNSFRGVSSDTINPLSFYRYLIMDMKVSKA